MGGVAEPLTPACGRGPSRRHAVRLRPGDGDLLGDDGPPEAVPSFTPHLLGRPRRATQRSFIRMLPGGPAAGGAALPLPRGRLRPSRRVQPGRRPRAVRRPHPRRRSRGARGLRDGVHRGGLRQLHEQRPALRLDRPRAGGRARRWLRGGALLRRARHGARGEVRLPRGAVQTCSPAWAPSRSWRASSMHRGRAR